MVQVPQKLHSTMKGKGSPDDVPPMATLQKAQSVVKVPVQLRLDAELARSFRVFCAERDLQLNEGFELVFSAYRKSSGI